MKIVELSVENIYFVNINTDSTKTTKHEESYVLTRVKSKPIQKIDLYFLFIFSFNII